MCKYKFSILILTLLLFFVGLNICLSEVKEEAEDASRNRLSLPSAIESLTRSLDESPSFERGRLGINLDYAADLVSIAVFWSEGEMPAMELTWWKAHHRDSRLLILALYRAKYGNADVSNLPQFQTEVGRFNEAEAKERLEEIKEVEAKFDSVKPALEKALARVKERILRENAHKEK